MRKVIFAMAFLAAGIWSASLADAQDAAKTGATAGQSAAGSGTGAAIQGGMQGDCPTGQVKSANGSCAAGQPSSTGTTTGSDDAGKDMPASPHQQEVLQPAKKGG